MIHDTRSILITFTIIAGANVVSHVKQPLPYSFLSRDTTFCVRPFQSLSGDDIGPSYETGIFLVPVHPPPTGRASVGVRTGGRRGVG